MKLTNKQKTVLSAYKRLNPKVLVLHGAKRSGKTFLNNIIFLGEVAKFKHQNVAFILAGASVGSVYRNVVEDWENLLGVKLPITKKGYIRIFGNRIYLFGGEKAGSWKKVRGFTSYGTYLNEMTALEKEFVNECFSRTSASGAKVICDTNPAQPTHYIKVNYIDNAWKTLPSGNLDIMEVRWTLYDNDTLPLDYIKSTENNTPTGATFDRDILGLWAANEGIVYKDFDKNNLKPLEEIEHDIKHYILGVDWGFTHYGAISVIGVSSDKQRFYLVDYVAKQNEFNNTFWYPQIREKIKKYKIKGVYVDSARSEYAKETEKICESLGATCYLANKSVQEGLDTMGQLIKSKRFIVVTDMYTGRFKTEIHEYKWGENEQPLKEKDDVLDSIRYAIFTYLTAFKPTVARFMRGFR